ncbi:hypothetical protein RF673_07990 [Limosilactobacillus fermentum]|uniref:hypothetical protein n=1 Tax=Limosilactobacillus fermentum TaxID=1613 RepID=UPI00285D36D2|nr:hypothetical protein [Limosilactobacillus fermentum]MDR7663609.1 hypothetical protein [Limosilactobacillus fermentum]MDR7663659.1 hypothetical protein [Limosilactobacillus fermentum]
MKTVYILTDSGAVKADKMVPEDYQLQANETFNLPDIPAYTLDYQPSDMQLGMTAKQELAQFALQQAQFQANQQKMNSQLALQLATLTAKGA